MSNRTTSRLLILGGIVAILAAIILTVGTTPANAHQPYGGCDEAWQAPQSKGADHCRAHGWTVKSRMVLDPTNRVRAMRNLGPCEYEDSENCYWFNAQGNGRGDSFIRLGGRTWFCSFGRVQ